jgi:hypothetical protein
MKSMVKKIAILSMAGMMQVGFGASLIEASPLHTERSSVQQQDDRNQIENERHEREMKRRPNESEREWHERQKLENQRHKDNLR